MIQRIVQLVFVILILWIAIYPVDYYYSAIQLSFITTGARGESHY